MPSRLNFPKVAPDRVYTGIQLPSSLCALTAHFHNRLINQAFILCCTVLEVAFTGCYPAPLLYGARTFLTHSLTAYARNRLTYSIIILSYFYSVVKLFYAALSAVNSTPNAFITGVSSDSASSIIIFAETAPSGHRCSNLTSPLSSIFTFLA